MAAEAKAAAGGEDEEEEEDEDEEMAVKTSILTDKRFADLFANPDFEVDMGSREFLLKNPVAAPVVSLSLSSRLMLSRASY